MPSSFSTSLRFELQFTGENTNTWGVRLNTSFQRIDRAIAAWTPVALTGDHTLTVSNVADDEARSAMLKFTGALSTPAVITLPGVSKSYAMVWNAADRILTLTTGAGGTVAVNPGDKICVGCDGANVYELGYNNLGLKDYIASLALSSTGVLPAQAGNAGRFIRTDGVNATWQPVYSTDLADINAFIAARTATATALAVAFAVSL